ADVTAGKSAPLVVAHPTSHHGSRTTAHAVRCRNACKLAVATPEWGCTLQGTVVAAGVTIVFPEASAAWAIIAGGAWTAGCQAVDRYFLSAGQANGLRVYALRYAVRNCFLRVAAPPQDV